MSTPYAPSSQAGLASFVSALVHPTLASILASAGLDPDVYATELDRTCDWDDRCWREPAFTDLEGSFCALHESEHARSTRPGVAGAA